MVSKFQILDAKGEVLKTYKTLGLENEFEGVDWSGEILLEAQLADANFKNANLYWGMLNGACLDRANFENANLQGANLSEASCISANFRRANLGLDNLGGATRLQSADLASAVLDKAILEGAEYDENTRFPEGFHPSSHGMIETETQE